MVLFEKFVAACTAIVFATVPSLAHHSIVYFDRSKVIEGEGKITDIYWGNPHIKFTVTGVDTGGAIQSWEIETVSVGAVRRFGLTEDQLAAGMQVRIAGNPNVALANRVLLTNMLLPNGREILFGEGERFQTRWAGQNAGDEGRGRSRPAHTF